MDFGRIRIYFVAQSNLIFSDTDKSENMLHTCYATQYTINCH